MWGVHGHSHRLGVNAKLRWFLDLAEQACRNGRLGYRAGLRQADMGLLCMVRHMSEPGFKDTINQYCREHFHGDFECTLADGKGRTITG